MRYRLSLQSQNWPFIPNAETNYDETEEFDEDDPCSHQKLKETVECFQKVCIEEEGQVPEKGKWNFLHTSLIKPKHTSNLLMETTETCCFLYLEYSCKNPHSLHTRNNIKYSFFVNNLSTD